MTLKKAFIPILLTFALFACSKAPEGEFSADMVVSDEEQSITTKIYVVDSLYRMEQEQAGETIIIIVNERTGFTHALVPSRKEFLEISTTDPVSLMNDPFQGLKYTISIAESDSLGQDLISGYRCDGYLLKKDDDELMTYWMSPELNFPVKIINHTSNRLTLELKNIKKEKIDRTLFQIPEGYRKITKPGEQAIDVPSWSDKVETAPIKTPPFEIDLAIAEMVKVKVISGKALRVVGTGTIDAYAALTAVPFKDGLPTKDPGQSTMNLTKRRTAELIFEETPQEADVIASRTRDGAAHVEVTHIDLPVGEKIPAGKEFRRKITPGKKFEVRFVSTSEGESSALLTFFKDGKELGNEIIGPESYRTLTFNRENAVEKKTYSPSGDEFVVKVTKGEVLVIFRPLE